LIGPSQHGKSSFLKGIFGTKASHDIVVGIGQDSVTAEPMIWRHPCNHLPITINFIDTPGLFDSRSSHEESEYSNHKIKEKIHIFLKDKQNRPNCVMLFYKFMHEPTEAFNISIDFAMEIATLHSCPIIMAHTFCDEKCYPETFNALVLDSDQSLKQKYENGSNAEQKEAKKTLQRTCFVKWKEEKEKKIKLKLNGILLYTACCMFNFYKKDAILPDGEKAYEQVMKVFHDAVGVPILCVSAEHAENPKAKEAAMVELEKRVSNIRLGMLGSAESAAIFYGAGLPALLFLRIVKPKTTLS